MFFPNWLTVPLFVRTLNVFILVMADLSFSLISPIILSINVSPRLHKLISKSLLEKMVQAGFHQFLIGCETADDELLKRMNRNQTFEDLLITTKLLKTANVAVVSTYWIIGLPGETRKSLYDIVRNVARTETYKVIEDAVYVSFHGYPRIETKAELQFYKDQGWDIVGQTLDVEATLSKASGCHYVAIAASVDDSRIREQGEYIIHKL